MNVAKIEMFFSNNKYLRRFFGGLIKNINNCFVVVVCFYFL